MSERIWIYQSDKRIPVSIQQKISKRTELFLSKWQAHGQSLKSRHIWMYDIFLILAVDESNYYASGCSIDESFKFIQNLETDFNVSFLNRQNIAYINNEGEIYICHISKIEHLIEDNQIDNKTLIFDNTITKAEELNNKWKVPLSESWIAIK